MNTLTQEKLKKTLTYYPKTGLFKWKTPKQRRKLNSIAGNLDKNGYRFIRIDAKNYFAHRLAYLYMKGSFPPEQCDHKNHQRDDNRFSNLREVSHQENQRNRSMSSNNKSGFTGVSFAKHASKWVAHINISGKKKHLGYFTDKDEAITARQEANIKYGFHFNHGCQ